MRADINLSLTFSQILNLVRQLPKEQKVRLSKELEKEAIESKLTDLLQAFQTQELSQEDIDEEVEAVRVEMYAKSKKH